MAVSARLAGLLRDASSAIAEAARPIRVLRTLSWSDEVERRFFAAGGRELPRPTYRVPPEITGTRDRLRALKGQLTGDNEIERFLRHTVESLATAAEMLLTVGRKDFYYHSVELYGRPASLSSDRKSTNLGLARHFNQVTEGFSSPLDPDDEPNVTAEEAAPRLASRFGAFFAGHDIKVVLDEGMAANASASAHEIRLKAGARFSRRDLRQIEFHEGQVHVATALNGRAQPVMSFLGSPTPRTTSSQEGLAVLTEFLTRSTSLRRIRRLSDRVLAIQMAEDGGSFLDVYRFFLGRGEDEGTAFDSARRVYRGGVLEGGAPFTKDVCYLDGLLRVTSFLQIALVRGAAHYASLLFAGKVAVEDVPLVDRLVREGLAVEPRYVPHWARDLSYVTALMSFIAFLSETDLTAERRRVEDRIARAEAEL